MPLATFPVCITTVIILFLGVEGSRLIIRPGAHDSLTLRCCISVSQGFCSNDQWMTDECHQFCYNGICDNIVRKLDPESREGPRRLFNPEDLIRDASSVSSEDKITEFPSIRMVPHPTLGRIATFVTENPQRPLSFDDFLHAKLRHTQEDQSSRRVVRPRRRKGGSHPRKGDHLDEDSSHIDKGTAMRWNGPQMMPMASNIMSLTPPRRHGICCRLKLNNANACDINPLWMQTHCKTECQPKGCITTNKFAYDLSEEEIAPATTPRPSFTSTSLPPQNITRKSPDVFLNATLESLKSQITRLQKERKTLLSIINTDPIKGEAVTTKPITTIGSKTLVPIHSVPDPFSSWVSLESPVPDSTGLDSCLQWLSPSTVYSVTCPPNTVSCGAFVKDGHPTTTSSINDVCIRNGVRKMGTGCKCTEESCYCWCNHKGDCNTRQELNYKSELCDKTRPSFRTLYKEIGWIECVM